MKCALCLVRATSDPGQPVHEAETQIGPLPVCGMDVEQALIDIGYKPDPAGSPVVAFLDQVDPKELEAAALERIDDFDAAEAVTGSAFLAVLKEAAREQAA